MIKGADLLIGPSEILRNIERPINKLTTSNKFFEKWGILIRQACAWWCSIPNTLANKYARHRLLGFLANVLRKKKKKKKQVNLNWWVEDSFVLSTYW